MDTTSATLLERVRRPDDGTAWQRFVLLYTPLLYGGARRMGLQDHDAADLVQDVLAVLLRKLPEFRYQRDGSFRAWLRTVLVNKWRERRRQRVPMPLDSREGPLAELPAAPEDDGLAEDDYRRQLVQRALEILQPDFQPATWKVWSEYVVAGRPPAEVAAELGISVHAVYLSKARVLRRLRQELDGLLE